MEPCKGKIYDPSTLAWWWSSLQRQVLRWQLISVEIQSLWQLRQSIVQNDWLSLWTPSLVGSHPQSILYLRASAPWTLIFSCSKKHLSITTSRHVVASCLSHVSLQLSPVQVWSTEEYCIRPVLPWRIDNRIGHAGHWQFPPTTTKRYHSSTKARI